MNIVPSVLMIASPIIIAAIGGMVSELSGVTNIGLEGLMGVGAFSAAAFHVIFEGGSLGSVYIALFVACILTAVFSFIHAYASISLGADQTVSGTGLNLLSSGVTAFFSQVLFSSDNTKSFSRGMTAGAFGIYPSFYIAVLCVGIVSLVLYKTSYGLRLRASGENPYLVESAGVSVKAIRYESVLFSGFCAGLAGACLVLTQTIQFSPSCINGTGFIALAAVSFGKWRPLRVLASSLLFAAAVTLALYSTNISFIREVLAPEVFSLVPYALTLLALVLSSIRGKKDLTPRALGKPFLSEGSS